AAVSGADHDDRRLWLIMGTTCEVRLRTDDARAARRAFDAAYRELALVDSLMSLYRPSSELSRLNRTAANGMVTLSQPTWDVFEASMEVAGKSDGAFDVTVKPLMDLWGFHRRAAHRPGPTQVDSVMSLVGWTKLAVDVERRGVTFGTAGMALDFGGIAKGYALDRAIGAIESVGIENALIDLGGNIVARGSIHSGAVGWPVAIRDPGQPDSILTAVRLVNEAVASSGGYEKFVVLDGVTVGHILDVRRGEPVTGVLGTAVLAPQAMLADALSTTLFVLGPEAIDWLTRRYPAAEAMVMLASPAGAGGKSFYSHASRDRFDCDFRERLPVPAVTIFTRFLPVECGPRGPAPLYSASRNAAVGLVTRTVFPATGEEALPRSRPARGRGRPSSSPSGFHHGSDDVMERPRPTRSSKSTV
ncbi:MAG: thiamine biosynthesis lipoprotein, partial [bacterium]